MSTFIPFEKRSTSFRGETVTSVAFDLGYESVAAFTTMFKRMFGAPPRQIGARGREQTDGRAAI